MSSMLPHRPHCATYMHVVVPSRSEASSGTSRFTEITLSSPRCAAQTFFANTEMQNGLQKVAKSLACLNQLLRQESSHKNMRRVT